MDLEYYKRSKGKSGGMNTSLSRIAPVHRSSIGIAAAFKEDVNMTMDLNDSIIFKDSTENSPKKSEST